ncbi:RNA polymerase sigma factor [Pedobacter sp. JCM 36344]|uniref:RNA polymerase sigma factor n=1 Tax=Pedobacter sp. JCM 36344 TaxID=3374280 RepID=UPI00397E2F55
MKNQVSEVTEEDLDIIDALKTRDRRRFEVFYKKFYRPLFTVAYRYVRHTQTAEEIVHDVFINIWNKSDQLNIQSSMKSYLFRSIVNSSLNYIKKEKTQMEKQSAYRIVHEQGLEIVESEATEAEEILLKGLEDALAQLPEKCKQVMYLSRFGKLKQQEIADQLEISIKTVKNHLTYGFKKLREHLKKHQQLTIWVMLLLKFITP